MINHILEDKFRRLQRLVSTVENPALAFSGGADSSFLAWFIAKFLKKRVFLFYGEHTLVSSFQKEQIKKWCANFDLIPETVPIPLEEVVMANSPNRCYHCKKNIFQAIRVEALRKGCPVIYDGSNAEDYSRFRPGIKALEEENIISPLALAGLTKREVREIARCYGLFFADTPSESCLATRLPYGHRIKPSLITLIDEMETGLRRFIFGHVRARYHPEINLLRLEVDPQHLRVLMEDPLRKQILMKAESLGIRKVTVDMAGFRSGSWDEK